MGQSLAGDGMLLRLRNASIALVATVAAVGLGLTLFISQLGFPAVFSGPIPDGPAQSGSVHSAVALSQGPAVGPSSPALGARTHATAPKRSRHPGQAGGGNSGGVSGDGPHRVAVSPGAQSGPIGPQHAASAPVSTPAPPAAEPAPSPAPVTAESPSKSGSNGQSQGGSDGKSTSSGPATAKLTSDGKSKSGPSKGLTVSKSDGNTASVGKSNDSAAEKARHDQGTAAAAPAAPAPSAATPAPQATSPAASKEAADSGR